MQLPPKMSAGPLDCRYLGQRAKDSGAQRKIGHLPWSSVAKICPFWRLPLKWYRAFAYAHTCVCACVCKRKCLVHEFLNLRMERMCVRVHVREQADGDVFVYQTYLRSSHVLSIIHYADEC